VMTAADEARYRAGFTIDRLVQCDHEQMSTMKSQLGADHMIFVHDSHNDGGSGGTIPVMLTGSVAGVGLHEWMHTFGLADEYAYMPEEAAIYCQQKKWVNVAIFNESVPSYLNSNDVRTREGSNIPWLAGLSKNAVLQSHGVLGTPMPQENGIYHAHTCTNASPPIKSWKPNLHVSVMEDINTNYIPQPEWPAILSQLGVSVQRIQALMAKPMDTSKVIHFEIIPSNVTMQGL